MKRLTGASALLWCVSAMVGCASKSPDINEPNASVTDISISPTAMAPEPQMVAAPVEPAPEPAIIDAAPPAPGPGAGRYMVQRGDTLWRIATVQYGSGQQWQRIAAANPGLAPTALKVGQTIVIPQ